jgi:hypothetical protein
MSTGAIVGSVAGGIAGLVFLALIIAFFLVCPFYPSCYLPIQHFWSTFQRRWRRNASDPDFNPEDFVTPTTHYPPVIGGPTHRVSTFDPSPPSMAQLHGHGTTPSMSGPGMAGHGAYPYAAGAGAALDERQYYTYGDQYDLGPREEDAMGGPYSSQPQQQSAYNAEAYGLYAHSSAQPQQGFAYSNDGAPALVPGAHAVAANRSTRSMDNEEAYGGY